MGAGAGAGVSDGGGAGVITGMAPGVVAGVAPDAKAAAPPSPPPPQALSATARATALPEARTVRVEISRLLMFLPKKALPKKVLNELLPRARLAPHREAITGKK